MSETAERRRVHWWEVVGFFGILLCVLAFVVSFKVEQPELYCDNGSGFCDEDSTLYANTSQVCTKDNGLCVTYDERQIYMILDLTIINSTTVTLNTSRRNCSPDNVYWVNIT